MGAKPDNPVSVVTLLTGARHIGTLEGVRLEVAVREGVREGVAVMLLLEVAGGDSESVLDSDDEGVAVWDELGVSEPVCVCEGLLVEVPVELLVSEALGVAERVGEELPVMLRVLEGLGVLVAAAVIVPLGELVPVRVPEEEGVEVRVWEELAVPVLVTGGVAAAVGDEEGGMLPEGVCVAVGLARMYCHAMPEVMGAPWEPETTM